MGDGPMTPALHADAQIAFALWVGVSVTVAALLLMAAVLVLRQLAQRRERQHQRAAAFWRGVLVDARQAPPPKVPPLTMRDVSGFVDAWNELHDMPGQADDPGMRAVAERAGAAPKLERLLARGSFHDRVMAIIAIGYLRSASSFERLAALIDDASPIISISAARALMRIDPQRAVQQVVPQIVARHDWVDGGVAQLLSKAEPDIVKDPLRSAALRANDEVASRLVRFLADVSPEAAAEVIREVLSEPHDEHLLSTCLQVMTDPADLDKVRPLLAHPRWHVRMHAASALGRLGQRHDVEILLPLLADPQWWVRYRTAQAIAHLLGGDEAMLGQLREAQQDRFARDILTQVIAEQTLEIAA